MQKNKLIFELTTKNFYTEKAKDADNWYVEALIATTDKDVVNDVIKPEALEKASETLKTKYQTVLFNHDPNKPIGKVVDAKVIDLDGAEPRKGLWVKVLISKAEPDIWKKIQEGVLSKFSFAAFVEKEPVYVKDETGMDIISHYIITNMDIFECSLVSIPANPNAMALDYYVAKYLTNIEEVKIMQNQELKIKDLENLEEKDEKIVEEEEEKAKEEFENKEKEVEEKAKRRLKDEEEEGGEEEEEEEKSKKKPEEKEDEEDWEDEEGEEEEDWEDEEDEEEEEDEEDEEKAKKKPKKNLEIKAKEGKKKPKITINNKKVDHTPWSNVNKIKLRNILYESGNKSAINEMYGVVRSYERMTDWGYPHHNLISKGENTYEMVLSYTGLMAAYKAMRGARGGGKNLTEEERKKLKSHLRRHFNQLISMGEYDEMPEGLKMLISLIKHSLELEDLSKDKNLLKALDVQIDTLMDEFKDIVEDREEEMVEKKIEFSYKEFLNEVKSIVKEALEEYFSSKEVVESNEEKSKEGENKMEQEKDYEKTIKELQEQIKDLNKKVEELLGKPIVKGMDSQREFEKPFLSLKDFIESDIFKKLDASTALKVAKIVLDNQLTEEEKMNKILKIIEEVQ